MVTGGRVNVGGNLSDVIGGSCDVMVGWTNVPGIRVDVGGGKSGCSTSQPA
ncbi:hypothetical protein ACFVAV_18160 [Nocardia sp. NPDC057663]|uniref:hypothetical protein n=1 Tax=Nocardia sp. NPDC057663 TaxID=3346201 RepID=UPI0036734341